MAPHCISTFSYPHTPTHWWSSHSSSVHLHVQDLASGHFDMLSHCTSLDQSGIHAFIKRQRSQLLKNSFKKRKFRATRHGVGAQRATQFQCWLFISQSHSCSRRDTEDMKEVLIVKWSQSNKLYTLRKEEYIQTLVSQRRWDPAPPPPPPPPPHTL